MACLYFFSAGLERIYHEESFAVLDLPCSTRLKHLSSALHMSLPSPPPSPMQPGPPIDSQDTLSPSGICGKTQKLPPKKNSPVEAPTIRRKGDSGGTSSQHLPRSLANITAIATQRDIEE